MATADTNKPVPEVIIVDGKPERSSLVELKNGKLSVKQKPMSFEKMSETMQEIVQFREMLEGRIERKEPPLSTIPEEHRSLFAKLAHESDKTAASIAKHVQHELLPALDEDDEETTKAVLASLPLDVVEKAIKSVATRVNYGLDASAIPNAPMGAKLPVGWQIWRWEVKEEFRDCLPKNAKDKAVVRIAERQQIREDVLALFQTLPESDKALILGGNSKPSNRAGKASAKSASIAKDSVKNSSDGVHESTSVRKADAPEDADNGGQTQASEHPDTPKAQKGRPKKPVDPEKAARERERLEKKLAKEEKEKKAKEAANKSRHLMANFFGKPKASPAGTSKSIETGKSEVKLKETAQDSGPSDFDKAFKGFLIKKDAVVAPCNWFKEVQCGRARVDKGKARDVIVIDDDEPEVVEDVGMDVDEDISMVNDPHLGQLTSEERLNNSLALLHPKLRPPLLPFPPRRHHTFKSYHPRTVRGIMQQLSEAEVAGDDTLVRSLLATLRDRSKIPAKVLVFHEDSRPGYFGTWTRNSREVGPRSPFARDVVSLDYTVDSEAEWEEEEEGDVLDGGEEDGEEDGAATEEVDSDLDSWLVDDDDIVDPGTPIDEREGSPDFSFNVPPPPKRKSKEDGDGAHKEVKKRKVVPLVPFTKGPCWENTIGEATYEPFKAYNIQLLSDTPFPIDPFKFVSTPHNEKALHPSNTSGTSKALASGSTGFAVPALPAHVTASTSNSAPVAESSTAQSGTANATPPRRAVGPPKTTFPEAHMPLLLAKIKELDTGNLTFIVETVYKELGTQKAGVKKNAIEAKVREIGEKSKDGGGAKVWVVKPDIRALYRIA